LLAQGLAAEQALQYGVCVHGAAGDACVARGLGPIGLTASEVAHEIRTLINAWTASHPR
jgi:NAD(P)H-hydrate repair Nnr-like enzyme with NAD(P)H-hydrate dehydratase domain